MSAKEPTEVKGSGPEEPQLSLTEIEGQELAILSIPLEPPASIHLSSAERAIVEGVLRGKSDLEIARERGTSPRTVAVQLQTLYRRLGLASRAELVVWATRSSRADR